MGSKAMGQVKGALPSLIDIGTSFIGQRGRKREQRAAQTEYNEYKADFNNLDTSNLYENQTNAYEDVKVNTQEADFSAQQNQQNQANMMKGMAGAAGGSGVAALAQAMVGTQSQNAQVAGASIGKQEASNQKLVMGEEANLQTSEIEGASDARKLQAQKTEIQLGMSQKRLGAANTNLAASQAQIIGGVAGVVEDVAPSYM